MSERNQSQSVSRAVQELSAKVATWEGVLAGWPCVIAETLADALEQSEAKAAERSRQIAQILAQERETWRQEMQSLLSRLTDAGGRQEALTEELQALSKRREHQHAPWCGGWSRDRWQVVVSVVLALLVSWGGVTIYEAVGPPATARAEMTATLENFQGWWNAATPKQREQIQQQRVEQLQERRSAATATK